MAIDDAFVSGKWLIIPIRIDDISKENPEYKDPAAPLFFSNLSNAEDTMIGAIRLTGKAIQNIITIMCLGIIICAKTDIRNIVLINIIVNVADRNIFSLLILFAITGNESLDSKAPNVASKQKLPNSMGLNPYWTWNKNGPKVGKIRQVVYRNPAVSIQVIKILSCNIFL